MLLQRYISSLQKGSIYGIRLIYILFFKGQYNWKNEFTSEKLRTVIRKRHWLFSRYLIFSFYFLFEFYYKAFSQVKPNILSSTHHSGQLLSSFIIWEPKHFEIVNIFLLRIMLVTHKLQVTWTLDPFKCLWQHLLQK